MNAPGIIEKFWMVMRLSPNASVQKIDSLPHKRYAQKSEAQRDAAKLTRLNPNARGYVVLECVGGYVPAPMVGTVYEAHTMQIVGGEPRGTLHPFAEVAG